MSPAFGRLVVFALVASGCGSFGEARGSSGGEPGASDGGSGGGAVCEDGRCVLATSCKELHAARTDLGDGVYEIDPDGAGPGAATRVHCDMTTDGGGWTLVARSVDGATVSDGFGWSSDRGAVDDDAQPFSFATAARGLGFTEILFGARGEGKTWGAGAPVYRHVVPEGFVGTYAEAGYDSGDGPRTVLGTCAPQRQGPTMLRVIGFTSLADHFAFTDDAGNPTFGLRPGGWNTNGAFASPDNLCSYTGELTKTQGMIFVR